MTNPTANRAYDMPASTDLVTNLPADFAIFGDAVDLDISSRGGYTTTATAAGTTTLLVTSNRNQRFTGTTTQNCDMPVASTLAVGARWRIQNKSTGIVTVRSSGGNTIYAIPANTTAEFVCILASGTTAASWDYDWAGATTPPSGNLVKIVNTQTGTTATGTTVLPNDGTIPQNTEGTQFMTLAITPASASNILDITLSIFFSCGVTLGDIGVALFQDSTANALAATAKRMPASTPDNMVLTYRMTAGTTSATTFKVRLGNADAGTQTFNPTSYGSVVASSITIIESTP